MITARIDPSALDALLAAFDRSDAPGFAVGVALGGVPGYRRGVGLASVELPVALSPTVRMRIGSTTKHFCCLAVMLLAEEGRLSPDDTPRRAMPELPGWADAITLRQLMSHTSGMRDTLDLLLHASGPGQTASTDLQLGLMRRLDSVDFAPGTSWSYNNGGYILLTEIVERVSGQPFGEFLRERIFVPVGMHDTLLRRLDSELLPNSATLHVEQPEGGWTRGVFGTPLGGEGGIVSTVDDMLLWLRHMSHPSIGTPQTWAAMRTPLAPNGYAQGLHSDTWRGLRTLHHSGTVIGGNCQMLKVLDHELDIIVMGNGPTMLDLHHLVDEILAACLPGPLAAVSTPAAEGRPSPRGTFFSPATARVIVLDEQDGRPIIDIGLPLPGHRDADGILSIPDVGLDLRITPIASDGQFEAIELTEDGSTDRLERVTPPDDAPSAPAEGTYVDAASGISLHVGRDASRPPALRFASELGTLDYDVSPIGPALWRARGRAALPLVVTLEHDPVGLRMTTLRTRRLLLARIA